MDKNGVFEKYDSFIKIYKKYDDYFDDNGDYGYGLKRFKTKQKKGLKPLNKKKNNNSCLIGGRILTLN